MTSEKAPERIWLDETSLDDWGFYYCEAEKRHGNMDQEYIRSDLVAAKDARIAELEKLVEHAFNEGFRAGMDEFTSSRGGVTWYDSKSRAALSSGKEG